MHTETIFTTANGHAAAATAAGPTDWRREAMAEAMRCAADDGTPQHILLGALHRHLPGGTARVFWEDRNRTLEAFARRLSGFAPLMGSALRKEEANPPYPVYGWWRGTNGEDVYEVVLAPDFHGDGDFLVVGPDAERVNALAERVIEDATRNVCRCLRYTSGQWHDAPEMQEEVEKTSWDDIVLAPTMLADIRRTIAAFFTQRDTFRTLRFPWRRGVLLVGPPGTGKTMVCKAAARAHPEVPFLYVRDLRSCRDATLDIFARARKQTPCILAFEDIDGLFDKENRTVFLNEMDGFRDNDGLLIIASSNHPERIDEALLKRPSRFDRVYHIGLPERAERAEYCRRLLVRLPETAPSLDATALAEQVADLTEGFTPAYLKEAFLSATLQMAQEGLTMLDESYAVAVLEQVDTLRRYLKKAKNAEAMADFVNASADNIGFRAR